MLTSYHDREYDYTSQCHYDIVDYLDGMELPMTHLADSSHNSLAGKLQQNRRHISRSMARKKRDHKIVYFFLFAIMYS